MKGKSYEDIFPVLFESDEDILNNHKLSEAQLEIKKRCLAIYTRKLADPLASDTEIAVELSEYFNVNPRTIYNDLRAIENLICAIKKANKEYVRYMVTETQRFAINKEKELIEDGKDSTKDLSYAVSVLAKAHGLDVIDPEMPNWDEIEPLEFEVTDDVTIMDIEDIGHEEVEKIKRKFLPGHNRNIEDATEIN